MANVNAPFGLRPIGVAKGNFDVIPMLTTDDTMICQFDAVAQSDAGTLGVTATPGTTYYSGIAIDARSSASTENGKRVLVIVNHDITFACQASGSFAAADEGLSANLVLTTGDSALLKSKHAVNSSTQDGSTATLDVHLRRLFGQYGRNEYGNYAVIECSWNKHRQMGGVAGV